MSNDMTNKQAVSLIYDFKDALSDWTLGDSNHVPYPTTSFLKALELAITALSPWISVDIPPKEKGFYIVLHYNNGGDLYITDEKYENGAWSGYDIKYWMDMPELPPLPPT